MDNNGRNSFLCRQSSTRWIPTADQIRILRELYYNNGVRSPTADQIQRISARLRQYGKIEGKNVFYWFQNHKARERQKKKLTMNCNDSSCSENKFYNTDINVPYHGFYDVGGNGYGGEQVFVERNLRESCLPIEHPTMPWNMYQYFKDQEEPPFMSEQTREIETLPLFPTRSKEQEHEEQSENEAHKFPFSVHNSSPCIQPSGYSQSYHNNYYNNSGASLELTLNSFHYAPPGSM